VTEEEQLVQSGADAEVLLQSSAFNTTINSLVDQYFQHFCNSKASDRDAREITYNQYHAVVELVSTLRERVAVAEEIKAKGDIRQEELELS
jgi:hypothetical protein